MYMLMMTLHSSHFIGSQRAGTLLDGFPSPNFPPALLFVTRRWHAQRENLVVYPSVTVSSTRESGRMVAVLPRLCIQTTASPESVTSIVTMPMTIMFLSWFAGHVLLHVHAPYCTWERHSLHFQVLGKLLGRLTANDPTKSRAMQADAQEGQFKSS